VSGIFAEVPLTVFVSDVNDCAPTITRDNYDIAVPESASIGSVVLKVAAQDNDVGKLSSSSSSSSSS